MILKDVLPRRSCRLLCACLGRSHREGNFVCNSDISDRNRKLRKTANFSFEIQNVPYVHKSDSSARVMGVDDTLNRYHHRSPMENRYLTADRQNLAFLGSSLTLGWGVPETDTFAAQTSKSWTNQKSSGSPQPMSIWALCFTVNNSISLYRAQSHLLKPKVLIHRCSGRSLRQWNDQG